MEAHGRDSHDAALARAAWDLYAVPPAQFVATRTAAVKELRSAGERDLAKDVAGLRRPSVSAAAVNAVVRAQDPVAEQLRDLGARLRHAQSALDAAGLAGLRGERDDLLTAWVRAAAGHAAQAGLSGAGLTGAVEAEVRATAVAALADAAATEVVLSGTLTRALSYSGFGEVDISDAVARTSTGVVLTRIEGGAAAGEDPAVTSGADGAGRGTREEESAGRADRAGADRATADRAGRADDARVAVLAGLRVDLEAAEAEVTSADTRHAEAVRATEDARTELAVTHRGLEQSRRLLAQAERHHDHARAAAAEADTARAEADQTLREARRRRDRALAALDEAGGAPGR